MSLFSAHHADDCKGWVKTQSDEYAISFSEGPCIATSGLVITTKLRDKVNIGRRYQEILVFDIPGAAQDSCARIFFSGLFSSDV